MSTCRFQPSGSMRILALVMMFAGLRLETAEAQPNEDGKRPFGILTSGTTLFGTAWSGGANDEGTSWSLNINTRDFTKLHDFSSDTDGRQPGYVASLGTTLYGGGITGGANGAARSGNGTIWSLDTATGDFNRLHDFTDIDGTQPGPVTLSGTTLWGLTTRGGAKGDGTIWSFDTARHEFATLHDFEGQRSLGFVASGSTLYGTAESYQDRGGAIWSLDTGTNEFTTLYEFRDGPWPLLGIVLSDSTLYGTAGGGPHDDGTIWSFDMNANVFTQLHDFHRDIDGRGPYGIVISDTTLYGVAQANGTNGGGTIWSLDTGTSEFNTLHAFSGGTDGSGPQNLALSGTTLYGTAASGGANGHGTIWSFDTTSSTFSNLHDFSPIPKPPMGPTIIYDDGASHVLAEDIENVIVTNDSTLDLRADVEVIEVNDGALIQSQGNINGRIEFGEAEKGLIVRDGANALVTSGSVFGVEVDAAKLVVDGAQILFYDCDTISIKNGAELALVSGSVGSADPSCSGIDSVDSRVHIDGAGVGGVKAFKGDSDVTISSGNLSNIDSENVYAAGTTNLSITGGVIEAYHDNAIWLTDSSTLQLSGGVVTGGMGNGIYATDEALIEMTGGAVSSRESSGIVVSGASRLRIAGGEIAVSHDFHPSHIFATQDSAVTLYGSDFNFPMFEPIELLEGEITGTLADGSSIEWQFRRAATASIILVPEPTSQLLVLLATTGLMVRRNRFMVT